MLMTWHDFRNEVLKTHKKGTTFKVRDSQGNRKAYRYIQKNMFPIQESVTEEQFGRIISVIHKYIIGITMNGLSFNLPYQMGQLKIGRVNKKISFDDNGKLKTNLKVDWYKTLRLWHDDKEAYECKSLIRSDNEYIYKIFFIKNHFHAKNKEYYTFIPSRTYKSILKQHIKNNDINVFDL